MNVLGGKRALVLALLAGLGTSFLVWNYMQKVEQKAKPAPVEMVSILIAARDVPARTRFAEDMFARQEIPVSAKHPNAVTSPRQVLDKVVKLPMMAGEQILVSKFFADRTESGLAFIVPPGKRAVAVAVNEVIGSGGLVLPGDDVDVVAVFNEKDFGQDTALYVLQKVAVLAVAQQMEGEGPGVAGSAFGQATQTVGLGSQSRSSSPGRIEPLPQPTAKTVTLAVAPDEALRVIIAEERGKIRLVLRPASEKTTPDVPAVLLKGLQSAAGGQPAQPAGELSTGVLIDVGGAGR